MDQSKGFINTRKRVIQEILQTTENRGVAIKPLAHQVIRNVLWAVMEETLKADDITTCYLSCSLLFRHREGWSCLTFTEPSFSNLYNCPLEFLAMADEINPTWRDNVQAFHCMMSSNDSLQVA